MHPIIDNNALTNREYLRELTHGIYVMQLMKNGVATDMYCVGAVGINRRNNNACNRLAQRNAALTRIHGERWQYIFFAKLVHNTNLYAAEVILYGRLCREFYGERIGNSRFHTPLGNEYITNIATETVRDL